MIHLANISWVQLILIGVGAVLQSIALCAFVRETSAYRARNRARKEAVHGQEQGLEFGSDDEAGAKQMDRTYEERGDEDSHHKLEAGNLTRTSKVKFVQKFDFRRHGT